MSIFKSFIKSAINQVGRDTGKVISNNIYEDKHSTPIRHISNDIPFRYIESNVKDGEVFYKPKKHYTFWWVVFGAFISFIPVLGFIFLVGNIVKRFKIKHSNGYYYQTETIYKTDRRYTTGRKILGNQRMLKTQKIPLVKKDRIAKLIICITYIIFTVFNLYFMGKFFTIVYK